MNRYAIDEPIAAIATALGPSALAAIRTSGKECIELTSRLFSRSEDLKQASGGTHMHGWIIDGGKKIDEVVAAVYRAPKSFTGEDMVEIFCHGGVAPVTAVHRLLLKNGFREALPGEFTFRAFINGKTDLTKAEAVREIIDSKTDESRSRACARLSGTLYNELDDIKKIILGVLAELEADIEYPEDENAVAGVYDISHLQAARDKLQSLLSTWQSEKLYRDGVRMVLYGRTNAGKSSLFNMFLKEDRAIVSDIPGTTRDWLESWITVCGIPIRLFDTAGLRHSDDVVEQAGVERSTDLSREADIVLYVVDRSYGLIEEDIQTMEKLHADKVPFILVWNKADKTKSNEKNKSVNEFEQALKLCAAQIHVSAKTGKGIAQLNETIYTLLTEKNKTAPLASSAGKARTGFGSLRQKMAADEALESLNHALTVPSLQLSADAVVQDLEFALSSLGEITGEIKADDVLENIFSRFCVGK